ncbi:MAG: glycosyltransferase family 1 protein [Acutalibacteraceae bacterium]
MIRVLQIVTDMRCGGLETMLMNYYRQIDRTQVQFDFLVHRENEGEYAEEIQKLGGNIYHLPKLNPFSRYYKKALGMFFDSHPEYQIIHVHQDCLSSVILKVAKEHGVKIRIAHSHSNSQDKNIKYPIKLFYKRFIPRYATSLFACSEEAGRWMFNGADFTVLNNAIDAERYIFNPQKRNEVRDSFGIASDELLVGHVGRFSPAKNHDFLIDVFDAVPKSQKAKLLLVGKGDLKESVEEKVKKLKLENRVIFAGLRSDVPDIMQAMDVLVLPSLYEGLGIVAIEAQASGLPCVLSDAVPDEAVLTDLAVKMLPDSSPSKWVDAINKQSKMIRKSTYDEIRLAGYDIKDNSKKLQEYYLRLAKGEKNICLY